MMLRLGGHAISAGHAANLHAAIAGGVIIHELKNGGTHRVSINVGRTAFAERGDDLLDRHRLLCRINDGFDFSLQAHDQSSLTAASPSENTVSNFSFFLIRISPNSRSWRSKMACKRTNSNSARNVHTSARRDCA